MSNHSLPLLEDCIISEKSKNGWVYDVEIFPNLFSVSFYNGKSHVQFEISERVNNIPEMFKFISNDKLVLIGYNNSKFDDIIIGLFQYYTLSNLMSSSPSSIITNIYFLAQNLIAYYNKQGKVKEEKGMTFTEQLHKYKKAITFNSIDLMKVFNLQKSLKLIAVSLKWHNIQDLPYPYDQNLAVENIDIVLKYNKNDTEITYELLKKARKEIDLRYNLSKLHSYNFLSESDSGISNIIFEKKYASILNISVSILKELKTPRTFVNLSDCVLPNVHFTNSNLIKILNKVKSTVLYSDNEFQFNIDKVVVAGKNYILGKGGLHSDDDPRKYVSDDKYLIVDSDVASYYPAIMINNRVKPENLDDAFISSLVDITQERLEAKKIGDKIKADGLKIVINSTFGKLGFENSFLYDMKAMFTVTLNGQFYLLMLIESLTDKKFEVISANTDGILSLVPRNRLEEYYSICRDWEAKLNFTLEYTYYSKYIRRDVNSYLAISDNGKIKSKGALLQEIDLKKGFNSPIVAYAVKAYFVDGIDVDTFLKNHSDIYDFCISEKTGSQFKVEYDNKPVQRSLRYYVSTEGKKLIKYKEISKDVGDWEENVTSKQVTEMILGKGVTLFNQYEKKDDYKIDYAYYKKEINKIIYEILKSESFIF